MRIVQLAYADIQLGCGHQNLLLSGSSLSMNLSIISYTLIQKKSKKIKFKKGIQSMGGVFLRLTSEFFCDKRGVSKVHVMRVNPKWVDVPRYC